MMDIILMTGEFALEISGWKYEGQYSFYDHNESHIGGFMDGTHYACLDDTGSLIGYYCFGGDARIPTIEEDAYDEGFLDIGLGMKPELCGRNNGLLFIKAGLEYAYNNLSARKFRLSVAVFNERAVKVYKKAGFVIEKEVTNSYFKNKFYIMKMNVHHTRTGKINGLQFI